MQNAIPINGLVKENPQADGTYAMLGVATSEDATFAAVITVDQFSNVTEMEPIDVAHAINGRIKREDWSSSKDQPFRDNSSRLPQSSEITIAQVLDVVNETYKGILSDDVLKHFDEERPTTGYYHGRVLFQERDDLPDDRALLMQARAEGRNAESLTAYQKKVRSLEALERKLHRQQDGLEAARSNQVVDQEGKPLSPEEQKKFTRDAVKGVQEQILKTEASIRRAEKTLADMERKPEMRQELEKALHTGRPLVPSGYPLHRKVAFGRLLLSFPFHTSRRNSAPIPYSLFSISYSLFPCACKRRRPPKRAAPFCMCISGS